MKVNVLGTEYDVIIDATEQTHSKLANCDGYCDFTTKTIVVDEMIPDDKTMDD